MTPLGKGEGRGIIISVQEPQAAEIVTFCIEAEGTYDFASQWVPYSVYKIVRKHSNQQPLLPNGNQLGKIKRLQ
jgi:hypothetical protein